MRPEDGASTFKVEVSSGADFDELVEAFERRWRAGERPTIEDFLTTNSTIDRKSLLIDLVHIDLECRLAAGESARVEDYLARFPDLHDDRQCILGLIRSEFQMRHRDEPHLLAEYAERFPGYREQLSRELTPLPPPGPIVSNLRRDTSDAETTARFPDASLRHTSLAGPADGNLLYGILALQNAFIDEKQLLAAINAWVLEKQTPIGQILLRQQAIDLEDLRLLEALAARRLHARGDEPQRGLSAISLPEPLHDELLGVADHDLQVSLAHVARQAGSCTMVGVRTSEGSRFRILQPHAKGGLGEVFVAEDQELRREVALKQIQEKYADEPDSRSRFLLEAEITGSLEHPGIVPVYGLGSYASGRPYYAMRFIRGHSLEDAIKRFHDGVGDTKSEIGERTLELRKMLARLIDVCNAIEYAHSRGVLHRDLKPANIMLGKYGETLVVDWGMAKVVGRQEIVDRPVVNDERSLHPSPASGSAPTQMGTAVGTPPYMSPEQAAGRHDELGPASDVYSLGATLYSLLTGQHSLADRPCHNVREALYRVQQGDIAPPRQIKPDIPKPLDAICRKAMAVAPHDRYSSPRALADDLEHWLADEPIQARPEGVYDRLFRLARRHRSVAIATTAAAILVALIAGGAAFVVDQQRRVADRLATDNDQLFRSEKRAHEDALDAIRSKETALEEAKRLADENAKHAERESQARQEADKAKKAAQDSAVAERLQKEELERVVKEKTELAAREQRNRQTADTLSEFLVGAIQPDDPTRFTGATFFAPKANVQEFTVFEMLKVELSRARKELKQAPVARAAVLDSIGNVCRQLALFESADRLLNEALTLRRQHLPADDLDLATSCFHTAWYYHERGDFERAKPLYHEALDIREKLLPNGPAVADTLQNLAWLHNYEASLEEMDVCFAKALKIREQLLKDAPRDRRDPLLRDVVFTKLGWAAAYVYLSRDHKSLMLNAKRIVGDKVLREQIIEYQHDNKLADALSGYLKAGDDLAFGDYEKAIERLTVSLKLVKGAGKEGTVLTIPLCYDLAYSYTRLRNMPEAQKLARAEGYYREALEIVRREQMFQIPAQGNKIAEVGRVLQRVGKAAEADSLWQEYLGAQEQRFGKKHRFYQDAQLAYDQFRAPRPGK